MKERLLRLLPPTHAGLGALLLGIVLTVTAAAVPSGPASVEILAETPVTAIDLRHQPAHNSPQIAMHPDASEFLALASRVDNPDFDCELHVSEDGGRSWVPVEPVPQLPPGADKCYAPEVVFGPDGRLHYLFVGLHGPGNRPMGAFLTSSTDGGRTFSSPSQVLGPNRFMVRLAIDPDIRPQGRLHLVWLEPGGDPSLGGFPNSPNPIMAAFSDDGGRKFSAPTQVSDPGRQRVVAPAVAIGGNDAVHVLYYDLKQDARDYQGLEGPPWQDGWELILATSSDGGGSFAHQAVVDDAVVPSDRVILIFTMPPGALATDGSDGVYVAWHDSRNGDSDVFVSRSLDGGRNFDPVRRVNDDDLRNGRHQLLPQLDVAPNGRVDLVFYDRRDDSENLRVHTYYGYSTDGAATFTPNLRLTSEPSDSRIGPTYLVPSAQGRVDSGSRLALVSTSARAVAAWSDTRNSPAGTRQQTVMATEVQFAKLGPSGTILKVFAVVLVGGAIALSLVARRHRRVPTG